MKQNAVVSWSGGKDSCYATIKAIQQGYKPKVLLNVLNEHGRISRSHGIPAPVLMRQAKLMHLPLHLVSSSWQQYESSFVHALQQLKAEYKIQHAIFGDIDLQEHRDWEEKVCSQTGISAQLPLWQQNRKAIVKEMLANGMQVMIVSCNATMGQSYLGRMLDEQLVNELEALGIDACGENGEYHTLVTHCSLFSKPLKVKATSTWQHEDYWFCTLE